MLSISNVTDSRAAAGYYEVKDDYYTSAGGEQHGLWLGDGAKRLGLTGRVDRDQFVDLLQGQLPDGRAIHNAAGGHRGGVDLTFSAPKSVSLMALLGGDDRIAAAHTKAVATALALAETRAGYRQTEDHITEHRQSGNLLVAGFMHELSRACDPQLRTHCVVLNATQRPDGEWRALDNEPLYRAKMLLGSVYRAELVRELQSLGYEVQLTHPDGRFELVGVDGQVLKAFSQRSMAMDAYLQGESDLPHNATAIEKKQAALATRVAKSDVDRDSLAEAWQQRLSDLGAELPAIPHARLAPTITAQSVEAAEAVAKAIAHLSERESAFRLDDLTCAGVQFGTGQATHAEVAEAIAMQMRAGTLIEANDVLTTPKLQRAERALLDAELAERHQLPRVTVSAALPSMSAALSAEQALAVHHILGSESRLLGVVGKAGTGKTTTLRTAVEELKADGVPVHGVAASSDATRLLAQTGVETSTVAAFLTNTKATTAQGGVLIVDEASLLSTKQVTSLLDRAKTSGFRILLVGDPGQLAAVEAGKPFAQLLASGMPTVTLKTIHRQRDATLKGAVELAAEGRTGEAVQALQHRVCEVPERDARLESVAEAYGALSPSDRRETIVVAGTRASRERLNQLIRVKLDLAGSGMAVQTLEKKDLTKQQAAVITAHDVGDVLVADRDYKSLGLRRGDRATVQAVTATTVVLADATGRRIDWRPTLTPGLSAHRVVEREISAGDGIRVTANVHALGLINGDQLLVQTIDQEAKTCTVLRSDGRVVDLDLSVPLPLDHAYCRTVYASQGATCERVLIEADTASLTANAAVFYVAISRARSEVSIFTADAERLGPAMGRSLTKASALDVEVDRQGLAAELE